MTYAEQIKHPKWQKRRLQILERDNFSCKICGDTETELHIHHKRYSGKAWEAKDEDLETTCKVCHSILEASKKIGNYSIISISRLPSIKSKIYFGIFKDDDSGRVGFSFYQYYNEDIRDIIILNQNCVQSLSEIINSFTTSYNFKNG